MTPEHTPSTNSRPIVAFALNCTLKPSDASSSTQMLIDEVVASLALHGVEHSGTIRIGDLNIKPASLQMKAPETTGQRYYGMSSAALAAKIATTTQTNNEAPVPRVVPTVRSESAAEQEQHQTAKAHQDPTPTIKATPRRVIDAANNTSPTAAQLTPTSAL